MNKNYDFFISSGTAGKNIQLSKDIFYSWIQNYYANKDARFFITNNNSKYIIFPIEKLNKYFDVYAKFRVKKSGSSSPNNSNINEILSLLKNYNITISENDIERHNKDFYLNTTKNLHKKKIKGVKYTYYFVKSAINKYKIRRLSNTNNANVIFSIKLINEQLVEDLKEFLESLEE
jgi:hypothetical protein